ncbi:MAG: hypothetical protein HW412_296 [Bacteroidetes bacterium]|nr:hypothetical protein [Bacteroidota bacterium]
MRMTCSGYFLGALLSLTLSSVQAGERSNIRGMGMGRTFVASSRGLDAVNINPANLAVSDNSMVTFSILPFGVHVGSDFLDYELYTRYFTGVQTDSGRVGRYLTEQDKKIILSSFTDPIASTFAELEARLIGVTFRIEELGAGALTVTDRVGAFADVPRDYLEFLLNGNPVGSSYAFHGTKVQASWTREYALSLGVDVPVDFLKSFAVGAAVKIVHGFGYYEVQRFNTSLTTDEHATLTGSVDFLARRAGVDPSDARFIGAYKLFPSLAGKGIGVDLGLRGDVNEFLSLAVSVTDIGSLRWNRKTEESFADTTIVVDDPLGEAQRSIIEDVVSGETRPAGRFSTPLPTTLRFGAVVEVQKLPEMDDMPGELLLEINYNQSLVETPYSTKNPRVSLGVEYKPISWLPLRSGVSFGGTDHMNLALGFGITLSVFDFELASENVTWLFVPNSFSRGSVAMGTRFRF